MKGGGKPGQLMRRKVALANLEKQLEVFKKAKQDKVTTRNKTVSFETEVNRMEREIEILKNKIAR